MQTKNAKDNNISLALDETESPLPPDPEILDAEIERVYATFRKLGGPTCSEEGVSGSLKASALRKIYSALPPGDYKKRVFDAGCGYGLAVLAFSVLGASTSCGVDLLGTLPVNYPIFDFARKELGIQDDVANIGFIDLLDLPALPHDPHLQWHPGRIRHP